jgi:hypothetical protein
MFFGSQDIEIWRALPRSGTFTDLEYLYHHTIYDVTIQPFSSNQGNRNSQLFENVINVMTIEFEEDILEGDELVFTADGSYGRVQVREPWGSGIIPHWDVYTTSSQWDRQNES